MKPFQLINKHLTPLKAFFFCSLFAFSCTSKIMDNEGLSIPPNEVDQHYKIGDFNLLVDLDYDEKMDTIIFQIEGEVVPFSRASVYHAIRRQNDSIKAAFPQNPSRYRRFVDKELTQVLFIKKKVPYQYLEHLFNWFRVINRRKLFLVTNGPGSNTYWVGIKFKLPLNISHEIFDAAISGGKYPEYLPLAPAPPPPPLRQFPSWSPLFYPKNSETLVHIQVSQDKKLQINQQLLENQASLRDSLALKFIQQTNEGAKKLVIWFDVEWDVTSGIRTKFLA